VAIKSFYDFLGRLEAVKPGTGGTFIARCPAHKDRHPSLSVKEAEGKILLKCHAGCLTEAVVEALGLRMEDLFLPQAEPTTKEGRTPRVIDEIYPYNDAKGQVLFEVVRYKPKAFSQRQPDGKGGYIWSITNPLVALELYHLPEVLKAITEGRPVCVVEGEKDANSLRKIGVEATCCPMGAKKWQSHYSDTLAGGHIIVIADRDSVGKSHAEQVATSLYGRAKSLKVIELPGAGVKDATDWISSGGTKAQLEQLTTGIPEYKPPGFLPEIVTNERHLRDKTNEILDALDKANKPEFLFVRSGGLARIARDEDGLALIEPLSEPATRGFMDRVANFVRVCPNDRTVAVSPPLDVVRDTMALGKWPFPPLQGVIEAPVIRPDGSIVTKPGYDPATRLYYAPAPGLSILAIPDQPTDEDRLVAVTLLQEVICDFPFDSEASRANALGTLLTPTLRPMIIGKVPLALFDKPQPGTGATLLAEAIATIATGRPSTMSAPKDDEDWRKEITSILLRGQTVVIIDNVEGKLYAPSLASLLTMQAWQARILGRSEEVYIPHRCTWIATGNNVKLGGDLPRRCYWIRLDAQQARPWQRDRQGFRHPNLVEWVGTERGKILAATLTVARAWILANRPSRGTPNLGGYEEWAFIIGGVLEHAGVTGFLSNLDLMYDTAEEETPQWEAFLETWHDIIGEDPVTSTELITHIKENPDLRATLPDAIGDTDVKNYSVKVGQNLGKRNGTRYPSGLELKRAGTSHRAITWKVGKVDTPTSPQFSFKCEVGEVQHTQAYKTPPNNDKNEYKDGVTPTSLTSHLDTKKVRLPPDNTPEAAPADPWDGMPDYPKEPCYTCGVSDFWPDFEGKRFVCGQCHPNPEAKEISEF